MSITDEIKDRIAGLHGSQLFYLPPLVRSDPTIRELFVTRDILEAASTPWANSFDGQVQKSFRAALDAFTRGDWLTVSELPFRHPPHTDIARVDPVNDEFWDIRCLDAWVRCLGTFGGKDRFIALTWSHRRNIDWNEEIEDCRREWHRMFHPIPRFRGDNLDEYLSNYYLAV